MVRADRREGWQAYLRAGRLIPAGLAKSEGLLAEFEFRYNHRIALGNKGPDRSRMALHGLVGKRLTYARSDQQPEA